VFSLESIGMEEAQRAMDAVLAALTPDDNPAALAIARADGAPILCLRQDGAPARMLRRARAKAYTAVRVGMNTVDFRDGVMKASSRTLDDWGDAGLTTLQGGMTVRSGGKVVGAIAMSGNTTQRDEQLAGIGLAAMGVR
jgi:glc operon protein GlcG